MASYDLVERLNNTFRQIELELQALQQALSDCRLLAGRVLNCRQWSGMPSAIRWPLFRWCSASARRPGARPAPLQPSVYPAAIGKPQRQGRRYACRGCPPAGYRRGAAGSAGAYSAYQCPEGHLREIVTVDSGLPTARFESGTPSFAGLIALSAYRTLTPLVDRAPSASAGPISTSSRI